MIALLTTIADNGAGAALAFSVGALLLSAIGIIAMLAEDRRARRKDRIALGSLQGAGAAGAIHAAAPAINFATAQHDREVSHP